MYARLAVCMWASVSVRRAALCAASVSSWGGTVRKARVLHVGCRLANTARLRATSFAWGLRRPAQVVAELKADGGEPHTHPGPCHAACLLYTSDAADDL